MGMEREFNPATHKEEYDKTEQKLDRVKSEITGEKTSEELHALVEERDRLVADLQAQRDAAEDQARADNDMVDLKHGRIQFSTIEIEERQQKIKELTKEIEEITGKKKQEVEQLDIETLKQSNQVFLSETFKGWYGETDAKRAKQEARLEKPENIDYQAFSQDRNEQKFGEYTLNPDTQNIDFEKAKVFIPDLSQFVGRPRFEVFKYVIDTYGATHHIPGIEYWKWMIENEDKAPQELKDGSLYYLPGSLLCGGGGRHWSVPQAHWFGVHFDRDAGWLGNGLLARARVVLLEKEKQSAQK